MNYVALSSTSTVTSWFYSHWNLQEHCNWLQWKHDFGQQNTPKCLSKIAEDFSNWFPGRTQHFKVLSRPFSLFLLEMGCQGSIPAFCSSPGHWWKTRELDALLNHKDVFLLCRYFLCVWGTEYRFYLPWQSSFATSIYTCLHGAVKGR